MTAGVEIEPVLTVPVDVLPVDVEPVAPETADTMLATIRIAMRYFIEMKVKNKWCPCGHKTLYLRVLKSSLN
jgi:hypothetical protein